MKLIILWSKWFKLKLDLSFSPQLTFAENNVLALVPPWTCAPQLMPEAYVEGGYWSKQPFYDPDPTLGIVYFDSWQSHELRVAIMRNALENGVERIMREKNKSKLTQELVEIKVQKIYKKYKPKKKSHLHKWSKKKWK